MRIEVDGRAYYLDFEHSPEPEYELIQDEFFTLADGRAVEVNEAWIQVHNGSTFCEIQLVGGWLHFTGYATVSIHDKFSKRKGRKVSFARAIQSFSPEERAEWWKAYFRLMPRDRG